MLVYIDIEELKSKRRRTTYMRRRIKIKGEQSQQYTYTICGEQKIIF